MPCALKLTAHQGPDDGNGGTPSLPGQNCSEDGESCNMDLDSSGFCPALDKINPGVEIKPGRIGTIDPKRPGQRVKGSVIKAGRVKAGSKPAYKRPAKKTGTAKDPEED